jgi:hypothetical protein
VYEWMEEDEAEMKREADGENKGKDT